MAQGYSRTERYARRLIPSTSLRPGRPRERADDVPLLRGLDPLSRRWVDVLDRLADAVEAGAEILRPELGTKTKIGEPAVAELPDLMVGRQGLDPWTPSNTHTGSSPWLAVDWNQLGTGLRPPRALDVACPVVICAGLFEAGPAGPSFIENPARPAASGSGAPHCRDGDVPGHGHASVARAGGGADAGADVSACLKCRAAELWEARRAAMLRSGGTSPEGALAEH